MKPPQTVATPCGREGEDPAASPLDEAKLKENARRALASEPAHSDEESGTDPFDPHIGRPFAEAPDRRTDARVAFRRLEATGVHQIATCKVGR